MRAVPYSEGLCDTAVRVLWALARFTAAGEQPTTSQLAEAVDAPRTNVHLYLRQLADRGLVAWEPRRRGTLRALVQEVPFHGG